uniref:Cps7J n=1 Tax=Streptococcus agalactiae TaxID=1311 RepID=Q67A32_STRAG|nr:Cps7J [Streptococcus agalactiae]
MKKISVIIPVYNVQSFLNECIDSVLAQTYSNLEIILVDDGSTDTSGDICDYYSKKDRRILVFHKNNGGLSDARKKENSRATGDYIYLLDSDDYLYKEDAIEEMVGCSKGYDSDIVLACYVERIGQRIINIVLENETIETISPLQAIRNIYNYDDYKAIFTVAHNKLYKRELFSTMCYPVGKLHEDEFLTYKLYLKAKNIIFFRYNTYVYRIREDSIMTGSYNVKRLHAIEALQERIHLLKEYPELVFQSEKALIKTMEVNLTELYKNDFYKEFYTLRNEYQRTILDFIEKQGVLLKVKYSLKYCILYFKILNYKRKKNMNK